MSYLRLDLLHGQIFADLCVHPELDAHACERRREIVDVVLRKAVVRDAVLENTARLFVAVIDGHRISGFSQVVGRRQSSGAGADDRAFLSGGNGRSRIEFLLVGQDIVAQRALHAVDVHGLAVDVLVAGIHADMRADTTGHHRHRVVAEEDLRRAVEVLFPDLRHVSRDIRTGRARLRSRGGPEPVLIPPKMEW